MTTRTATISTRGVNRPRRQGLWRLLILVLMLLIMAAYIQPVMKYIDRSEQIESERAITEELRSEFDLLQSELTMLQEKEYIEQVARRDLGLVKPGEQPYVLKDLDQGAAASQGPAVVEEPTAPTGAGDAAPEDFPLPLP